MSTQLRFPTLASPALLWLTSVPRWRIQGYRVYCGPFVAPGPPWGDLVCFSTQRATALTVLAWHQAQGRPCVLRPVLVAEESANNQPRKES